MTPRNVTDTTVFCTYKLPPDLTQFGTRWAPPVYARDRMTAVEPPTSFVGRVVDERYEVSAELGEGSVGMVYKAMDRITGKPVALKIWHAGSHDIQTRGRFVREAKALDVLKHPGIVEVYGYGFVDNVPYVAMEFLEGETLDDLIESGEVMAPKVAFDLFHQMLTALAFAHDLSVVHRDLKPENIFLLPGPGGRREVRILDYGLAKFLMPEDDPLKGAAITMTGMVMGTPLYMPPEQAAGSPIDLRADVYAAGCIFFEMLTGRLPFIGDNQMELLRAHMLSPIPIVSEVNPDVVVLADLQTLLERAMAKKADERFKTAGEMLAALQMLPPGAVRPKPASFPKPAPDPASAGLAARSRPVARPTAATDLMPPRPKPGGRLNLIVGGLVALLIVLIAFAWSAGR